MPSSIAVYLERKPNSAQLRNHVIYAVTGTYARTAEI